MDDEAVVKICDGVWEVVGISDKLVETSEVWLLSVRMVVVSLLGVALLKSDVDSI